MLAVNRKPDAFDLAIPHAGPYDLVRMQNFTNGRHVKSWKAHVDDDESADDLAWLPDLSALLTIQKKVVYPPIMLDASDGDPIVHPVHTLKMLAELQLQTEMHEDRRKQEIGRLFPLISSQRS
jgi:prolyl oligopeptidase